MQTEAQIYEQVAHEQRDEHLRQLRTFDDAAFVFLLATNNDIEAAVKLFDDCIDLLCESGVLQMHAYREILKRIREGL
jgi:hypothetical protein